jgi:hypothetical protein
VSPLFVFCDSSAWSHGHAMATLNLKLDGLPIKISINYVINPSYEQNNELWHKKSSPPPSL